MSFDDCRSVATTSSNCSDDKKSEPELDTKLLQLIKDTKYQKGGAKFSVFGGMSFQRECLESHNFERQRHGCPSLTWCPDLGELAQNWAAMLAEKGRVIFPEIPGVGENIKLFKASDSTHLPSGSEVTEIWAKEVQNYDYDKPRWGTDTQHFTQMIWKESRDFGVSRCWLKEKNLVVVVALYRPGGNSNTQGEFSKNVPRPVTATPSKKSHTLNYHGIIK